MKKIVFVSSDNNISSSVQKFLENSVYNPVFAEDGEQGLKKTMEQKPDIVIVDIETRRFNGLQVIEKITNINRNIAIIVLVKSDDITSAIKAVQIGAFDYIEKPLNKQLLKNALDSIIEVGGNLGSTIEVDAESNSSSFRLIGKSPKIKEVIKRIGIISMNRVTTLLEGETGTGKEVISKIIHEVGVTRNRPFVAVNCSALTETLLESELFGHVKGAFTDAIRDKIGKFEIASDGTILLDEISEISPNIQLKLLRVIQESEFERVGGEKTIPMKARIIASTNKSLEQLVEIGKFREDLYYRLKVFNIILPPLRDRLVDVPLLVNFFINESNPILRKNIKSITHEAIDLLMTHSWPGNVRELEHSITRAMLICSGDTLDVQHFQIENHKKLPKSQNTEINQLKSLAEIEKDHILYVLEMLKWQKSKAASVLGISRPTLNQKIQQYEIMDKL